MSTTSTKTTLPEEMTLSGDGKKEFQRKLKRHRVRKPIVFIFYARGAQSDGALHFTPLYRSRFLIVRLVTDDDE